MDDGVGDAPQQNPTDGAEAFTPQDDEVGAQLPGEPDDLFIRLADRKVRLLDRAPLGLMRSDTLLKSRRACCSASSTVPLVSHASGPG